MEKYLLERIYHYSTALTSWSWTKLYGDRSKKYKEMKSILKEINVWSLYNREYIVGFIIGFIVGVILI
jgi:hypothetical protein